MDNPLKILQNTEKTIKGQYRKQLLEEWYKTKDNAYYLHHQRLNLYRLVQECRTQSNSHSRLLKQLEVEALAEFLNDYELTP